MIQEILHKEVEKALTELYSVSNQNIQFQNTSKDFNGDITLVVFALSRASKKGVEETAEEIGNYLHKNVAEVTDFNVVKGFLNLEISKNFWFNHFLEIYNTINYGVLKTEKDSPVFLIEYSSPNTNKPLHLGHLRNNFLGYSIAEILKATGKNVKKVAIDAHNKAPNKGDPSPKISLYQPTIKPTYVTIIISGPGVDSPNAKPSIICWLVNQPCDSIIF